MLTTYNPGASETKVYTPFPDYEVTDPPTGANVTRTTYRLGGQIAALRVNDGATNKLYYPLTDHLGNVMALSDVDGNFVSGSDARYDPFGVFTTTPTTNPSVSNLGFTGHRHNNTGTNNLGLIYMNARYFLPEVGRFVSPDTIVPEPSEPQGYNRYAYSLNNPVRYTDPSGHMYFAGEQFGGMAAQARSGTTALQQASSSSYEPPLPPLPSPIVTTPRVVEQFPLPDSSDLTQWLIDILIAYANSDQINDMASEWLLSQLLINTSHPRLGGILMGDVLQEWFRHVYTGAVWDFKPDLMLSTYRIDGKDFMLGGVQLNLQAVANIFYGFIGRHIGMSELVLQAGAGAAQLRKLENWKENWIEYPPGMGDQEFDAWAVAFGFRLFDLYGNDLNGLTATNFATAMITYVNANPVPPLR